MCSYNLRELSPHYKTYVNELLTNNEEPTTQKHLFSYLLFPLFLRI